MQALDLGGHMGLMLFASTALLCVINARTKKKAPTTRLSTAPVVAKTTFASSYDCIIIGAGVSGLQAAKNLIEKHGVDPAKVILLEAQDYVGGRMKQNDKLVPGFLIELGAEILHGQKTLLTQFGEENDIPIDPIYCWAHGDGGPIDHAVNGGYGLYYLGDKGKRGKRNERLLRFDDDQEEDWVELNEELWCLHELDEKTIPPTQSLYDYLHKEGYYPDMMEVAQAGYANTLCNDIKTLPLKQVARWGGQWETEGEEEGDFKYRGGFKALIDVIKDGLDIRLNHVVKAVQYDATPGSSNNSGNSSGGVAKVRLASGQEIIGKSVLFTGSVHVLQQSALSPSASPAAIAFSPPLPPPKLLALQSVQLQPAVKVFASFSQRCWPRGLAGMICSDNPAFFFPEIWFRSEGGVGHYATGFATAGFAQRLIDLGNGGSSSGDDGDDDEIVVKALVDQLQAMFASNLLTARHWLHGEQDWKADTANGTKPLPLPDKVLLKPGLVQRWSPRHAPFVGGGYASGVCTTENNVGPDYAQMLAEPCGSLFFAGEGTNYPAGATAHAAMESGVRAAKQISQFLSATSR